MRYTLGRILYIQFLISLIGGIFWIWLGQYSDYWVGLRTPFSKFKINEVDNILAYEAGQMTSWLIVWIFALCIGFLLLKLHLKIWDTTSLRQ